MTLLISSKLGFYPLLPRLAPPVFLSLIGSLFQLIETTDRLRCHVVERTPKIHTKWFTSCISVKQVERGRLITATINKTDLLSLIVTLAFIWSLFHMYILLFSHKQLIVEKI